MCGWTNNHDNIKIKDMNNEILVCKFCGKVCKNPNSLRNHERLCPKNPNHQTSNFKHVKQPWNKGLTSETDPRVRDWGKRMSQSFKDGTLTPVWLGKHHSSDTKKISDSMKKAHSEGRAHNIGECRWNNEPSYPEKFFMKVIENEFVNKNYVKEKPFGRFSLDFAWVDLKKCIEIDGKQHETDEKQKVRDVAKNKLLADEGWELLRIKWSDMFNDPKTWIQKAKDFIDK